MPRVEKFMVSLPDSLLAEVDRIAAAEQISRSDIIREAVKLYIEDRRRRLFIEQMKKGYLEMANINLALAIEHYRLESEVTQKFELPGTEVK
ncbi:ribbon-helix-helix protein, CopG family [Pelotomaculum isophthalicicum JI]|uniref:Ribbon-helix-helix protein, CopG family n=1 Tax=Pelotomaculum isophthalicicum JI TaxID=947010 RepID=A0A9X4H5V8_9FIRM|nr:ribbon-helix-helix protein, CopG family [Pelotomaculum isophthalicicum]MDF9407964.1 ribbon-helix-helix protein, CopG family [Pelotomaculum isophthalicicum JI]